MTAHTPIHPATQADKLDAPREPKTNAQHQAAYRARRSQQFERRGAALATIVAKLEGNDKSLAVELRRIAEEGLK